MSSGIPLASPDEVDSFLLDSAGTYLIDMTEVVAAAGRKVAVERLGTAEQLARQ